MAHVEGERVRGARGAKKTVSKLGQEGIEAELEDIRQSLELLILLNPLVGKNWTVIDRCFRCCGLCRPTCVL